MPRSPRQKTVRHFESLQDLIVASNERITQDVPDQIFLNNVNLFVKSYLITMCTYLEAFLQDTAFECAEVLGSRLRGASIPHNVVQWVVLGEKAKDKELSFKAFALEITRTKLADQLSGNPGKTLALFRLLGVDLSSGPDTAFTRTKDVVGAIVSKRNDIIHHNSSASDIAMMDLVSYIQTLLSYMKYIEDTACASINFAYDPEPPDPSP